MQSSNSQWSGIFFDGSSLSGSSISRGDNITITGKVTEHYGSTKIINVTEHTINSSGNEISAGAVQTIDLNQNADEVESYEGLLVSVTNVSVVDTNRYDWSIKDGSQVPCLMDDDMATMAADNFMSGLTINQNLDNVMGVFNYSFNTYKIQIRDLADLGQTMGADDDVNINPFVYRLGDNFPNPFNPETHIQFELGGQESVKLIIYDGLGRLVRTLVNGQDYNPGLYSINWNGMNNNGQLVPSGVYIYRIKAGNFIAHKKMLLVK
jgi:hypothetical protein